MGDVLSLLLEVLSKIEKVPIVAAVREQGLAAISVQLRAHNLSHDNRQLIVLAINCNRSPSKDNCN